MSHTDPSLKLQDLVPPEPLLPHHSMPVWVWFAIAAVIIALAAAIILISRMKSSADSPSAASVRDEAYRAAMGTLENAPSGRIQDTATAVSSALRRYLAAVASDPALYETHEEFVSRHQVLTSYSEELRAAVALMFAELARLKYGRDAVGDRDALVSGARHLLDQLHQFVPAP